MTRGRRHRFSPGICGETPFLDVWDKRVPVTMNQRPLHRAGDRPCRCIVDADHKDWSE